MYIYRSINNLFIAILVLNVIIYIQLFLPFYITKNENKNPNAQHCNIKCNYLYIINIIYTHCAYKIQCDL